MSASEQTSDLNERARKNLLAKTSYEIAHGEGVSCEHAFKAGFREGVESCQPDELSKAQERVKELEDLLDDLLRNYELGKRVDDQILAVLDPKRPQP